MSGIYALHSTAPAGDAFAITPNDGADLAIPARAVYVGQGGSVALITIAGNTVTFVAVPAGFVLPVAARRVLVTGTTAASLIGLV